MPGRRVPRRTLDEAVAVHLDNTFLGGLNGSSSIPEPVIAIPMASMAGKDGQPVYFQQDTFKATGGMQTLSLTYIPILNSEHVYMRRNGQQLGLYQREKKGWTREAGKRDLVVLNGMNTRAGDEVVVEYAYYAQAAAGPTEPPLDWHDSPLQSTYVRSSVGTVWVDGFDRWHEYGNLGSKKGQTIPANPVAIYTDHIGGGVNNEWFKRMNTYDYTITSDTFGRWYPGFLRFGSSVTAYYNQEYADEGRQFIVACNTYHFDDRTRTWAYEPWDEWTEAGEVGGFRMKAPDGSYLDVWPNDDDYDWDHYDEWTLAVAGLSDVASAYLLFSGQYLVPYPVDDPTGNEPYPVYQLCHISSTQIANGNPDSLVPTSANYCADTVFATCELYNSLNVTIDITSHVRSRPANYCIGGQVDWQTYNRGWNINIGSGGMVRMHNPSMSVLMYYGSPVQWALLPQDMHP